MRVFYKLICKKRKEIDLVEYEEEIIHIVSDHNGKDIEVTSQGFSFDWELDDDDDDIPKGTSIAIGRDIAKIKALGCKVNEYPYEYKDTGRHNVSRQLFRRDIKM